jgi:uncharacterized protein YcsI (UPF0317 family)
VGIAAPVVCAGAVRGSLGVSLPGPLSDREVERIGAIVVQHANLAGAQLHADEPDVPRLLSRRPTAPERLGSTLQ